MIGPRLGHAGSDRADADFGHQLDRDPCRRIDVLQIVDQLRDIFDRIDVVMRRRRDQADAGRRMAHAGDRLVDLRRRATARPRPAWAPCAILIWISSALTRYSVVTPNRPLATCLIAERIESPLGRRAKRSASSPPSPVLDLPPMRFIATARVVCASRLIEPKLIAPGGELLDDLAGGLDLGQGERLVGLPQRHQPANGQQALRLVVDLGREFQIFGRQIAANGVLQAGDAGRGPGMLLAPQPQPVHPADIEHVAIDRVVAIGPGMPAHGFMSDLGNTDALRSWSRCR